MEENRKKTIQYAEQIVDALSELFSGGDKEMDLEELSVGENLTNFIHALTNIAPTLIYNQLTGENINNLKLNHIANQLCFQYSATNKKEKDE